MSEEKKSPRPLAEINNEYTALCAQAGQKQYQIECGEQDLKALNAAIRTLNNEAAARQQEDAESAKESNVTPISEGASNA